MIPSASFHERMIPPAFFQPKPSRAGVDQSDSSILRQFAGNENATVDSSESV